MRKTKSREPLSSSYLSMHYLKILEGSFGCLPIEVKYGSNTRSAELRAMQNFIEVHDLPLGVVVNHSPRPSRIAKNIVQVPVSCLWG